MFGIRKTAKCRKCRRRDFVANMLPIDTGGFQHEQCLVTACEMSPVAQCLRCGKWDFEANLIRKPIDNFPIGLASLYWVHEECYQKAEGIQTCPTCAGKGEVPREAEKKAAKKKATQKGRTVD